MDRKASDAGVANTIVFGSTEQVNHVTADHRATTNHSIPSKDSSGGIDHHLVFDGGMTLIARKLSVTECAPVSPLYRFTSFPITVLSPITTPVP